jgi:hypothetical protein
MLLLHCSVNRRLRTANCQLPAASCQLRAADCEAPFANFELPAADRRTANCQLPAANCELPAAGRQLSCVIPTEGFSPSGGTCFSGERVAPLLSGNVGREPLVKWDSAAQPRWAVLC